MKNKIKENKKRIQKINKLKLLRGIDLCACGPLNNLKCQGICRKTHTKNEKVICSEIYRVDDIIFNLKKNSRKNRQDKNPSDKRKIHKKKYDNKENFSNR